MKFWKRRTGAHALEGCCARNIYAVMWAPLPQSWVRVISFGPDDYVVLTLDNEVMAP